MIHNSLHSHLFDKGNYLWGSKNQVEIVFSIKGKIKWELGINLPAQKELYVVKSCLKMKFLSTMLRSVGTPTAEIRRGRCPHRPPFSL